MAKQAPDPRDISDFQFLLKCRLKVFSNEESIAFDKPCHLVAAASRFGLIFVGSVSSAFQVIQLDAIENCEFKDGELSNYPHRIVNLPSRPKHLSINCDCTKLAVVVEQNGCAVAFIYDVPSMLKKELLINREIRLSANPSVNVLETSWNPTIANIYTACKDDGTLGVYEINESGIDIRELPMDSQANCMCWSPKGKQIAVGLRDGRIIQYKPDLKAVKIINAPPLQGICSVIALQWISNCQFIGLFKTQNSENSANLMVVDAPKVGGCIYTNYDDICYSYGNMRPTQFYTVFQPTWNILMAASSNSMEVGVLGNENNCWLVWILGDSARAELPLSSTKPKHETFPIGLALDTGSMQPYVVGDITLPPTPYLLLLSDHGLLCCFRVLNNLANATSICHPREALADVSGMDQFTISPSTPKEQSRKIEQLPSAPKVETPKVPQSILTQFAFPSPKPGETVFTSKAESKPIFNLGQNTMVNPSPLEAIPSATTVTSNSALTSATNVPSTEKIAIEDSDVLVAKLIREECEALEAELIALLQKGRSLKVNLGTDTEAVDLVHKANELEEFLKEVNETNSVQSAEVHSLKQGLIQTWAWYEDARSRFAQSQDLTLETLLRIQRLDPVSQRYLADIKHMCYYINSQVVQVQRTLDEQWETFQDSCKNIVKMKIPTMEAIYQTMVRQNAIQQRQQYILKDISRRISKQRSKITNSSILLSMNNPDQLERELERLQLEPQHILQAQYDRVSKNLKRLTMKKIEKLSNSILDKRVIEVTYTKPKLSNTSLQASLLKATAKASATQSPLTSGLISPITTSKQSGSKVLNFVQSTPIASEGITKQNFNLPKSTLTITSNTSVVTTVIATSSLFQLTSTATISIPKPQISIVNSSNKENINVTPISSLNFNSSNAGSKHLASTANSAFVPASVPTFNFSKTPVNVSVSNSTTDDASSAFIFGKGLSFETPNIGNAIKLNSTSATTAATVVSSSATGKTSFNLPNTVTSFKPSVISSTSPNMNVFQTIFSSSTQTPSSPTMITTKTYAAPSIGMPFSSTFNSPQAKESPLYNFSLKGNSQVLQTSATPTASSIAITTAASGNLITEPKESIPEKSFSENTVITTASNLATSPISVPLFNVSLTTTSSSLFNTTSTTTLGSLFGTTSGLPFNTSVANITKESIFNPPVESITKKSIFNTPVPSTTPGSLFNTSFANTNSGSLFNTSVPSTTAGSLFNTSVPSTTAGSLFNTSVASTTSGSLFNTSVTNTTSGSIFKTAVVSTSSGSAFNTTVASTTSGSSLNTSVASTTTESLFKFPASSSSIFISPTVPTLAQSTPTITSPEKVISPLVSPSTTSLTFSLNTLNTSTSDNTLKSTPASTSSMVFGTPVTTSIQSIFGANITTTSAPLFNVTTTSTTPSLFSTATVCATIPASTVSKSSELQKALFSSINSGSTTVLTSTSTTSTSTFSFGSVTAPTNIFKMPASTFSAAPTGSIFGTSTTATTTTITTTASIFGSSGFNTTPTTSSLFGTSTTPFGNTSVFTSNAGNMFGNATSTSGSIFGQPAAFGSAPVFGSPTTTTSVFSSGFNSNSSPFGSPTSTQTTFGNSQSSTFNFAKAANSNVPFGFAQPSGFGFANSPSSETSSFSFGNLNVGSSANTTGFGSGFGQTSSSNPFAKTSTTEQKTGFAGGSIFGSPTTTTSASIFGGGPASGFGGSSFGATSGFGSTFSQQPTFGQNNPTFGVSFNAGNQSGPFSAGNQSVSQTGFGAFGQAQKTEFVGSSVFGSPGFGSSPAFGGNASFGGSPAFGNSTKLFGNPSSPTGAGTFGVPQQENSTFANLASQNTLGFGALAQQQSQSNSSMSGFGGGSSFSTWR